MTSSIRAVVLLLVVGALGACAPPALEPPASSTPITLIQASRTPEMVASRVASPAPTDTLTPNPTAAPSDTAEPTATLTPTPEPPTATPTPALMVRRVEPTFTPHPGDERARVGELPLGEPGYYVNVTYGYWVQYPTDWHTDFGNRPLLVSFSDLDPGTHNRESMRADGCLVEINAAANIFGFTFEALMGQLPRSFPDAQWFELDGQAALRVRRSNVENDFDREEVFVEHDHRLFVITFEYARTAAEVCQPAWEELLAHWQWFTPQFAVYRNTDFGYAVSHPRGWYRFNSESRGISFSSQSPTEATDLQDFLAGSMLVETTVLDNPDGLSLKSWLAAQEWQVDLTNDIPLDGIIGVRILRESPTPGIQEMSGYFQGPRGRIYVVTCLYPVDRKTEFRPIANAIIYSFEF